jgi:hypothetical protein
VSEYTIKPLSTETWDAFARLCEKHNGMGFGQCWCTWFHPRRKDPGLDAAVEAGRPYKESGTFSTAGSALRHAGAASRPAGSSLMS